MNWHFPRVALAEQILGMFESGLSFALVFFAPRRMGKTEFLLNDMRPVAEKAGWFVFYHSFLDTSKQAEHEFTKALHHSLELHSLTKTPQKIKRVSGGAFGLKGDIELIPQVEKVETFVELLTKTAKQHKIILLLDEIQALVKNNDANLPFVTSLRTVLDTHKEKIKVIFTGSSREGLKKMFSSKDAPFFHFGQNLAFPQFGPEFTEHLAKQYTYITRRKIDVSQLWNVFVEFGKMPQLIRALVERVVLHPDLTIDQAKNELLEELTQDREFEIQWDEFSHLEKLILNEIAVNNQKYYSLEMRDKLAKSLGVEMVSVSTIQTVLRKLNKKCIVGHDIENNAYFIDDPNFKEWILQK